MITGSGLARLIVQVCVTGSNPGTGTFRLAAVEAGMSKTMSSTPGLVIGVGIDDRLPQAARAGVVGVGDDERR